MKPIDKEDNYLLDNFRTQPQRRDILKSLLALGVGSASVMQFANALATATDAEVAKLVILSQPGVLPKLCNDISTPLIKKMSPKTEIEVISSNNAASYPRMLAQRSSPSISGSMINDLFAQRGIADGMWEKFDPAIMTNLRNIPPEIMTPGGFGIIFLMTPYGIMYNPDRVEKPTSWLDLWNPKYAGRVSMWDAYFDAYIMAAIATGKGPNILEGIKAWSAHKKNIGAWVSSPIVEADMVDRGEVWLAPHWGAWAELARSQGKKVAFTIPKEGAVQWGGHMQLSKGFSPAVSKLSQAYMNTWLSDEFQLEALKQGFLSPVSKAVKVPDDLKRAGFISVDDAITKLIRPDFKDVGEQMPKIKALIDRTLKG